MRPLPFKEAITWAVFMISLLLVAVPYINGDETLSSLLHNRLALIGAVTLILLFLYNLPSLLKEKPAQSVTETPKLPAGPEIAAHPATAESHERAAAAASHDLSKAI